MQQWITAKGRIRRVEDATPGQQIHFVPSSLIFHSYLGHSVEPSYPKCLQSLQRSQLECITAGTFSLPSTLLLPHDFTYFNPSENPEIWKFTLRLDITWCLSIDKHVHQTHTKIPFLWLVPIAIFKASLSV